MELLGNWINERPKTDPKVEAFVSAEVEDNLSWNRAEKVVNFIALLSPGHVMVHRWGAEGQGNGIILASNVAKDVLGVPACYQIECSFDGWKQTLNAGRVWQLLTDGQGQNHDTRIARLLLDIVGPGKGLSEDQALELIPDLALARVTVAAQLIRQLTA